MVLKAYFDDSKTDGQVLVLGGYIASAERWAHFSDEWQEVLSIRPAWRRFKASEVCASQDEVTKERVRHHYRVIRDHVLADICIAIPIPAFQAVCAEFGLSGADANAYFLAWNALISILATSAGKVGITDPIELYFDTQSEKTKILLAWDNLERQMPNRWRKLIKGMPSFQDDEEVMPLQAADFGSWWLRKAYLDKGTLKPGSVSVVPWETDPDAFPHIYAEAQQEGIRKTLMKFRDFARFRLSASISIPTYGRSFDWGLYGVRAQGRPE